MPRPEVSSSLPSQSTSFVGRAAELAEFARILGELACRLLTLLGPGGIGKTRLALAVAARQTAAFADGVAFVALASVGTSDQIVSAIGESLGLAFAGQADPPHICSAICTRGTCCSFLIPLSTCLRAPICSRPSSSARRISRCSSPRASD